MLACPCQLGALLKTGAKSMHPLVGCPSIVAAGVSGHPRALGNVDPFVLVDYSWFMLVINRGFMVDATSWLFALHDIS